LQIASKVIAACFFRYELRLREIGSSVREKNFISKKYFDDEKCLLAAAPSDFSPSSQRKDVPP
jgi:hypothetical protein